MSLWKPVRPVLALFTVVCLAAAANVTANDQDKKDAAEAREAATKQAEANAAAAREAAARSVPADDTAKQMEAWAALAKTNEHHERLKRMAGEYDVESEMVMQPGAPPQKSKGKHKATMIMGGRYLLGEFTGEMMGQTFRGAGLTGYDNAKKKYFGTWIDDMGTGMMVAEGTCSPDGKVMTLKGEYDDPMTNQKHKYRWVTTVVSDDKHVFEWFDGDKDGKNEFRMLRVTYTRVK